MPGTTDHIAHPNQRTTVACVKAPTRLHLPGRIVDEITYYELELNPGQWHVAVSAASHWRSSEYQDDGSSPLQTYRRIKELNPEHDPRAAFLFGLWYGRGHRVTVYESVRVATSNVLGRVSQLVSGSRILTHEGWFTLEPNMFLLQSRANPGICWLATDEVMRHQCSRITTVDGEVVWDFEHPHLRRVK